MLDEPQTVYVGLVLLGFLCVAVLFVAARYYRLKASIAWNAIADGADSASTGAPVQGRQLGFNDVEASTPSTGAHADSLAYECECRSLRRSKRKQRSSECKRKEILTHTHLLTSYTKLTYIWFFWWCLVGHEAGQSICHDLSAAGESWTSRSLGAAWSTARSSLGFSRFGGQLLGLAPRGLQMPCKPCRVHEASCDVPTVLGLLCRSFGVLTRRWCSQRR